MAAKAATEPGRSSAVLGREDEYGKGFYVLPRKDGRGVGAHMLDIGSGVGGPTLLPHADPLRLENPK